MKKKQTAYSRFKHNVGEGYRNFKQSVRSGYNNVKNSNFVNNVRNVKPAPTMNGTMELKRSKHLKFKHYDKYVDYVKVTRCVPKNSK